MRKSLAVFVALWALLMVGLYYVPVTSQQPFILQVANGASTGSGLETVRSATLANFPVSTTLTARNLAGTMFESGPSHWTVVSVPAAGSQGSASIAAEAAVRHVADCISWSADSSGGAVTAAAGTLVIRDGATGAGTIIWELATAHLVAAAAGVQTIAPGNICGLRLVGTTNTAMTAEFNAGVTNEVQAVTLLGYNVQ